MKMNVSKLWQSGPFKLVSIILFAVDIISLVVAQILSVHVENTYTNGPTLLVVCNVELPAGHTTPTIRWIFSNKTLAENTALIDADPSRYHIEQGGSQLFIENAIKEDEGFYQCQLEYYLKNGRLETYIKGVQVDVIFYLPPLKYPECSIEPSSVLNGSDATFNCTVGDSNSDVNLNMTLEKQDASFEYLGDMTVTRMVTVEDNNAMLICHMTSGVFLTANRTCSAGPILVTPSIQTTSFMPISTIQTASNSPMDTIASTNNSISGMQEFHQIWIIVGGAIAALVILMTIIICVIQQFKKSKPPTKNHPNLPETTEIQMDQSTDNVYSAETSGNMDESNTPLHPNSTNPTSNPGDLEEIPTYAAVDKPNTSSKGLSNSLEADACAYQNSPANHAPNPDGSEQIPTYAVVDKTNTSSKGLSNSPEVDTLTDEDTSLLNQGAAFNKKSSANHAPNIPTYAAVDKTNTSSKGSSRSPNKDTPEYEDTVLSYPDAASDPPIYSEVNKGYETESMDDVDNGKSSGFVDNAIYVSSGPL